MAYDQKKHDVSTNFSFGAARIMLPYILGIFKPDSYLELGAGYCHWANEAKNLGVSTITAVDGPWTDISKIAIPRSSFVVAHLDAPLKLDRKFDLALSLEVGEHVKTEASQILVGSLVEHSDVVVFGAATPLQGGFLHINEQWQSFWQKLFENEGFATYDIIRPKFWSDERIIFYYRQNPLVYVRKSRLDIMEICEHQKKLLEANPIVDLIHPRKYLDAASYDVMQMRILAKKLPGHIFRLIARKMRLA